MHEVIELMTKLSTVRENEVEEISYKKKIQSIHNQLELIKK
jgi:hypothetical protein